MHTVFLERLEEAGADLQTDAVNEEDKAKVLNEGEHFGRTGIAAVRIAHPCHVVEVSHDDACEQHERYAQRDATELDFSEHDAYGNDKAIEHHDMGYRSRVHEQ